MISARVFWDQAEQNPGAYSIPGTGGRAQNDSIPYTVTVPQGVRAGQEFQVMAGGLPMVVSERFALFFCFNFVVPEFVFWCFIVPETFLGRGLYPEFFGVFLYPSAVYGPQAKSSVFSGC